MPAGVSDGVGDGVAVQGPGKFFDTSLTVFIRYITAELLALVNSTFLDQFFIKYLGEKQIYLCVQFCMAFAASVALNNPMNLFILQLPGCFRLITQIACECIAAFSTIQDVLNKRRPASLRLLGNNQERVTTRQAILALEIELRLRHRGARFPLIKFRNSSVVFCIILPLVLIP